MSRLFIIRAALLLGVASCSPGGDPWSDPPMSGTPDTGSQAPQPPGSLPSGSVVNAPLTRPGSELMMMGAPTQRGD